jgi:hypothetical protein
MAGRRTTHDPELCEKLFTRIGQELSYERLHELIEAATELKGRGVLFPIRRCSVRVWLRVLAKQYPERLPLFRQLLEQTNTQSVLALIASAGEPCQAHFVGEYKRSPPGDALATAVADLLSSERLHALIAGATAVPDRNVLYPEEPTLTENWFRTLRPHHQPLFRKVLEHSNDAIAQKVLQLISESFSTELEPKGYTDNSLYVAIADVMSPRDLHTLIETAGSVLGRGSLFPTEHIGVMSWLKSKSPYLPRFRRVLEAAATPLAQTLLHLISTSPQDEKAVFYTDDSLTEFTTPASKLFNRIGDALSVERFEFWMEASTIPRIRSQLQFTGDDSVPNWLSSSPIRRPAFLRFVQAAATKDNDPIAHTVLQMIEESECESLFQ